MRASFVPLRSHPEYQVNVLAGLLAPRSSFSVGAAYTGEIRLRAGQGPTDSSELVEDVLDDVHVPARRPAGAQPGRPQIALVGESASF